jgi:hypothetical protein
MVFPQSIRQGDSGMCDQNGLGCAEKWTSVSPCLAAEAPHTAVEVARLASEPAEAQTLRVVAQVEFESNV